jgi:histidyl-tRNA synthetase
MAARKPDTKKCTSGRSERYRIAANSPGGGAYILVLNIKQNMKLSIGVLGVHTLKRGTYLYIGSAKSGIGGRVRRHIRLSSTKSDGGKWHIDNILKNSLAEVAAALAFPGAEECAVSAVLASDERTDVPVAGFGSSDCRCGCPAHLYRFCAGIPADPREIEMYIRTRLP